MCTILCTPLMPTFFVCLFCFFETPLAILELTMYTRLAWNSEMSLPLSPPKQVLALKKKKQHHHTKPYFLPFIPKIKVSTHSSFNYLTPGQMKASHLPKMLWYSESWVLGNCAQIPQMRKQSPRNL